MKKSYKGSVARKRESISSDNFERLSPGISESHSFNSSISNSMTPIIKNKFKKFNKPIQVVNKPKDMNKLPLG